MDDARPVLDEVLEDQALTVLAALDDLRLSPLDSVHDTRVALRRLRSSLKGFGPLLADADLEPLAADLRWLAGELSDARDVQVATVRIRAALEWVPAGPDEKVLLDCLEDASAFAVARASAATADPRFTQLQQRLQGLLVGRTAHDLDPEGVQSRVAGSLAGLLGRLPDLGEGTPAELHEVRKRAKRARAMLAAVTDSQRVLPKRSGARRVLRHLHELQDRLGHHQDAVTTAALLREIAPRLGTTAPLAVRLAEHEDTEAEALRSSLPELAEAVLAAARRLERRTPGVELAPD